MPIKIEKRKDKTLLYLLGENGTGEAREALEALRPVPSTILEVDITEASSIDMPVVLALLVLKMAMRDAGKDLFITDSSGDADGQAGRRGRNTSDSAPP